MPLTFVDVSSWMLTLKELGVPSNKLNANRKVIIGKKRRAIMSLTQMIRAHLIKPRNRLISIYGTPPCPTLGPTYLKGKYVPACCRVREKTPFFLRSPDNSNHPRIHL